MKRLVLTIIGMLQLSSIYCATVSDLQKHAMNSVAGAVNKGQFALAARLYLFAGKPTGGAAFSRWNTVPGKEKLLEDAEKALTGGGNLPPDVQKILKDKGPNYNENALATLVADSDAVKKLRPDKAKGIHGAIMKQLLEK